MHLILTGATGLVGSATLHSMLLNPAVTRISVFSRSPVPQASDSDLAKQKCAVHIHKDFAVPPSPDTLTGLRGARGIVWALGISQTEVDKDTYTKITFDYTMAWARALADADIAQPQPDGSKSFNFVYVSGEGATTTPGRLTPIFGVVKGRAEQSLLDLSIQKSATAFNVYSARPGGVDRSAHPEIAQYVEARESFVKQLYTKPLFAVSRLLIKDMMSPTKPLGAALVTLASGDGKPLAEGPGISGQGRTVANVALRKLAGL